MDEEVVGAVVDKTVTGIVVAVNAAILVAVELLDSEAIACVNDLVVRFVVVSTGVDLVVRVVVAIVGFVVLLVVDLSVDVDLEVSLVVLLVVSWVVFSCLMGFVLVAVVVVVCPMPKRVSLFTYWICWTGVSLWARTVTEGARIPVQ